jgi:uncharacterized protein YkwD
MKLYILKNLFFIYYLLSFNNYYAQNNTCLSAAEKKLYNEINNYRKEKKLPTIPISASLTTVAQKHAKDLFENRPDTGICNLHSWSDKGNWTACCYTPNHVEAKCMWQKPLELTGYKSNGFEISYKTTSGEVIPANALSSWKKSPSHNAVIINSGIWKKHQWKAIGIGIYANYAIIWFGDDTDTACE